MSTLSIAEFQLNGLSEELLQNQIVQVPSVAESSITFSAVSTQSVAFNPISRIVRLSADTACRVTFGTNPTANALTSILLPANSVEYFGLRQNSGMMLAVIASI